MYHVSAQGVDKRMINVHYHYYKSNTCTPGRAEQGETRRMVKSACVCVCGGGGGGVGEPGEKEEVRHAKTKTWTLGKAEQGDTRRMVKSGLGVVGGGGGRGGGGRKKSDTARPRPGHKEQNKARLGW